MAKLITKFIMFTVTIHKLSHLPCGHTRTGQNVTRLCTVSHAVVHAQACVLTMLCI